jgi:hypothetical protein
MLPTKFVSMYLVYVYNIICTVSCNILLVIIIFRYQCTGLTWVQCLVLKFVLYLKVLSFYSCSLLSDCNQHKTLHTEYLIRRLHWEAAAAEIRKNQTSIR